MNREHDKSFCSRSTTWNLLVVGLFFFLLVLLQGCGSGEKKDESKRPDQETQEGLSSEDIWRPSSPSSESLSLKPAPDEGAKRHSPRSVPEAETEKSRSMPPPSFPLAEEKEFEMEPFSLSPRESADLPPEPNIEEPTTGKLEYVLADEEEFPLQSEESTDTVTLYFGTNRTPVIGFAEMPDSLVMLFYLSVILAVFATMSVILFLLRRRNAVLAVSAIVFLLLTSVSSITAGRAWLETRNSANVLNFKPDPDHLHFGKCQVSIPPCHIAFQQERPSLIRLEVKEDPAKHIVLREKKKMKRSDFLAAINADMKEGKPSLLLFIHGYSTSFEDGARRLGQLAYDIDFEGIPVLYSWPSQGGILSYKEDLRMAEKAGKKLREFMQHLLEGTDAESINIVAHSMGNRVLTSALRGWDHPPEAGKGFQQIILAAPDIGIEQFCREMVAVVPRFGERVTLYSSPKDLPLNLSDLVNDEERIGGANRKLLLEQVMQLMKEYQIDLFDQYYASEALDTREAFSAIPGIDPVIFLPEWIDLSPNLGHNYYASNPTVVWDIREVIHQSTPPERRAWLMQESVSEEPPAVIWVLQEDLPMTAGRTTDTLQ